jgi:hypothetical protein
MVQDRNISFHAGYNALFVVNPNNMSSQTAKLVIGFPGREVEEIVAWLESLSPDWYKVDKITDKQIQDHPRNFPSK